MILHQYSVLTLLAVAIVVAVAQDDLIVRTVYGDVEGHFVTLGNGQVVRSFLGIPFTAPPTGDLRFSAPEEPQPWTEVFVADRLGDACPQDNVLIPVSHPDWDRFNEDCLNINIYTPYNHTEPGPYPVHVFIHGGGYFVGANIQYLGHFHAARGVIFVAPNYRLAQLGYLYTGDDVARGNYGMLDQILALRFVQQNIANFGGDPNRVTVSGHSAGGTSVGHLIVSPMATGLFQQGILFSGADAYRSVNRPHESVNFTRQIAEDTDCLSEDTLQMVTCLRGLPTEDLMNATFLQYPGQASSGFRPVPDLLGGVLPDYPPELREAGQFMKVPVMVGRTDKEWGILYEDEGYNSTEFHEEVRDMLENTYLMFGPRTAEDVIKAAKFQYTPWPHTENRTGNRDNLVQMRDDISFGEPSDRVLRYHAAHNTTAYQYEFAYRAIGMDDISSNWTGAFHGADMPFMFGHPLLDENPEVAADQEMEPRNWTETDKEYSNYWMNLLTNFIKFGNPTPSPVPAPGGKPPTTWTPYRLDSMDYLYIHNDTITVRQNLMQRNNAFWREYVPWLVDFTASTGAGERFHGQLPVGNKGDEGILDGLFAVFQ